MAVKPYLNDILNDKIHYLMLEHSLRMSVGDKERYIESGHRFTTQYDESLSSLHQESSELVCENCFYLIRLFDLDAHAY